MITEILNKNNIITKRKEVWCDSAKGIVILLMIIGHMPNYIPHAVREIIYSFHMPFFFIISGYWYKKGKYQLKEYFFKKIKHFISTVFCI